MPFHYMHNHAPTPATPGHDLETVNGIWSLAHPPQRGAGPALLSTQRIPTFCQPLSCSALPGCTSQQLLAPPPVPERWTSRLRQPMTTPPAAR